MAALGLALVACVVGLLVLRADPALFEGWRSSSPHGSSGTSGSAHGGGRSSRGTATTSTATPGATSTPGSSSPGTEAGPLPRSSGAGAPLISALSPGSGRAGEQVTITGSGFHSADGVIVALFGSAKAPTRCPSYSRCVATVPPGQRGSVVVRVRTEGGLSNGTTFAYR